jgi:hypothetical protein
MIAKRAKFLLLRAAPLLLLPALAACKKDGDGRPPAAAAATDPARTPDTAYQILDTLHFSTGPEDGYALRLTFMGRMIDTLGYGFGFHHLGPDTLVYRKIRKYPDKPGTAAGEDSTWFNGAPDSIRIAVRGKPRSVERELPYFGFFASPSFLEGSIYYWGVSPRNDTTSKVYGIRYDVRRALLDSVFLYEEVIGSEYSGHFTRPYLENGLVVYKGSDAKAIVRFRPDFHKEDAALRENLRGEYKCDGRMQDVAVLEYSFALTVYLKEGAEIDSLVFDKNALLPIFCLDNSTLEKEDLIRDKNAMLEMLGKELEGYGGSRECKGLVINRLGCETDPIHVYWDSKRNQLDYWRL